MSLIKGAVTVEDKLIFKSYSRLLLRHLKGIRETLSIKDYSGAEKLLNELINDTQKDIESGN